jgi:PAS domain S-box-containing protein
MPPTVKTGLHIAGIRVVSNSRPGDAVLSVLDTVGALVVLLDSDGRVTFFNRASENATGYRRQEVAGRRPWEFLVAPDDVEQERIAFENLQQGAFSTQREAVWIGRDGSSRLIAWSNARVPGRDEIVDTGVDLTERRKAEQALQREKDLVQLLETIAKAANESATPEAAIQVALDRVCAHMSWPVGHAWLVDAEGRMVSSDLWQIAAGEERQAERAAERAGRLADRARVLARLVWLEGDEARRLGLRHAIALPVQVGQNVAAVLDFYSDEPVERGPRLVEALRHVATQLGRAVERKRAEEERERLLAREQAALAEAESGNRARDLFLATLSHELRTPLTTILGWVQMLSWGKLDAERARRALRAIEANAVAQGRLIDDILDLSRIIMGKLSLEMRAVEVAALVHDAVESVRPAAEARAIHVDTEVDPRAAAIHGDRARLLQVLGNLLSNSVKFSRPGSRIDVTVAPHVERAVEHTRIVVRDTGKGIAPAILPYVFDPFRQADSSSTRTQGGLGLGLAIVRRLVDLHHGTVIAESAGENQGSTFTVDLPVARVAARAVRAETLPSLPPEASAVETARLDGLHVLVVDDVADARQVIALVLESFGAQVQTAGSASEALRLIEREPLDLLVSDVAMPVEDGYDLIGRVRASPLLHVRRLPAVALTAYAAREDRERALSAGFQAYVPKPVDARELARVLALVMGRPPRSTEIAAPA